jgi:alanine-alpha-ketoisovalerate/valine-pyruvate aminotransferase
VVSLLQSNDSKNRGSGAVCFLVTRDPRIVHQAINNLEAISEPDQLTNSSAGHRVRIRRKRDLSMMHGIAVKSFYVARQQSVKRILRSAQNAF